MKNSEQVEYFCFNVLQRVRRHASYYGRGVGAKGLPGARVTREEEEVNVEVKEEGREEGSGDCVSYSLHR